MYLRPPKVSPQCSPVISRALCICELRVFFTFLENAYDKKKTVHGFHNFFYIKVNLLFSFSVNFFKVHLKTSKYSEYSAQESNDSIELIIS